MTAQSQQYHSDDRFNTEYKYRQYDQWKYIADIHRTKIYMRSQQHKKYHNKKVFEWFDSTCYLKSI